MRIFQQKKTVIVLMLQIALILCLIFLWNRPLMKQTFSADSFSAADTAIDMEYLSGITEKSGLYIDNGSDTADGSWSFVSPLINFPAGSYRIDIHYSANDKGNIFSTTGSPRTGAILTGYQNRGLEPGVDTEQTISFLTLNPVSDYQVLINYSENGYFYLNDITVEETLFLKILATVLVILFIILSWCFLLLKRSLKIRDPFTCIGLSVLFLGVSIPLFTPFLTAGHDLTFHLNRIEAISSSLKNGVFPNRIGGWWNGGSSYPAAIFYAETYLYFPALLRLAGFSVQTAYKAYVLAVNASAVCLSFYSFSQIFKNRTAAVLSTVLYVAAPYRLVCIYLRAAAGEYTAMVFYPLVICALWSIYSAESRQEHRRSVLLLIAGYSGVIECHILGTLICVIFTVITALILWKKTFTLRILTDYISAAAGAFLLNAWYIIPFLTFDKSGITVFGQTLYGSMGRQAAHLWQIFSLFPKGAGENTDVTEELISFSEMPLSLGMGLISVLVICILIYALDGKISGCSRLFIGISILSILMSSDLFPWDQLQLISPAAALVISKIQFPWRFLGVASVTLAFLGGAVFLHLSKSALSVYRTAIVTGMLLLTIISAAYFTETYMENTKPLFLLTEQDLDSYDVVVGEYLLDGTDRLLLYDKTVTEDDGIVCSDVVCGDGRFTAEVNNNAPADSYLEIPIQEYSGYVAVNDLGERLSLGSGNNNNLRITIPAGYSGSITVYYPERKLWIAADLITLVSLLAMLSAVLMDRRGVKSRTRSLPYERKRTAVRRVFTDLLINRDIP